MLLLESLDCMHQHNTGADVSIGLCFDLDALPESNVIGNVFGGVFRVAVGPGSVRIYVLADLHAVIASLPLPATSACSLALDEIFAIN